MTSQQEEGGVNPTPTTFRFYLERRGDVWVVAYLAGGCRPATDAEVELWLALQAVEEGSLS